MSLSMPSDRWRKLCIQLSVTCISFYVVVYLTQKLVFSDNYHGSPERCTLLKDEILSSRDVRYALYGEGEFNEITDKNLRNYIRSVTSTHTVGERRRLNHPEKRHYSQIGQSEYIDKLLQRRRNGIFLESGAYDGETLSNSLFFELHRNWTGILIEANPIPLKSLIKKNRKAFVVRGCLSVTSRPAMVMFSMHPSTGGEIIDNFKNTVNNSLSRPRNDDNINILKRRSKVKALPQIYVHCFPLMSIVDALDIHHIDYISLDVEGPEVAVLNTIDWSKLTVDAFTIEYGSKLNKLGEIRALFDKTGHYKEAGILPVGKHEENGQDVVFTRI